MILNVEYKTTDMDSTFNTYQILDSIFSDYSFQFPIIVLL
ncbi:MAG: hypothetical protein ACJA1A_000466 [Saprospiraceae bacterium]|jgi:hypothetical protein